MASFEETKKKLLRRTGLIECMSRLHKSHGKFDCMTVTMLYNKLSGDAIDWHIASDLLNKLANDGFLMSCGVGGKFGVVEYRIK